MIMEQQEKIEDVDQYSKRNNVLFDHVLEKDDEDAETLVHGQCSKLGIHLVNGNIQAVHRIGKSYNNRPRPIIARFTSVNTARTILTAVKAQFKGGQQQPDVVNAREHLSEQRGKLLKECLTLKKDGKIISCWVFNYTIYIKRSKSDEKGIKIQNLRELFKITN
jgi:hypothetical protein